MKKLYFIAFFLFMAASASYAQSNFWGMTSAGGAEFGTIFKTDADGSNLVTEEDFMPGYPGMYPYYSQLCAASNGKYYGLTQGGGIYGLGVLFEYDPVTFAYTDKIDFLGAANGNTPVDGLIQALNGKMYGTTNSGGVNGMGTLFEYDPGTNTLTKKVDFAGTTNGKNPCGTLLQASNGLIYGLTSLGGLNNYGILFEYDPGTGILTNKIDFNMNSNGSKPYGNLMQASNGNLYGMTFSGGANNMGTIFQYVTSTGVLTKKIDFNSTNGRYPYGGIIQATGGLMYGMTYMGGANDQGTLFEYNSTSNTLTSKIDFSGTANGCFPYGNLLAASNGKLYGMTYSGGTLNLGVLFDYDPSTSTLTKKIDFSGTAGGSNPRGTLIQATSGTIFGMTNFGGLNNSGILFSYDITGNTLTDKVDFSTSVNGKNPYGSLMQATNGKFYGLTNTGGSNNFGVLFEYDPITYTYVKKIDFAGTSNGKIPTGTMVLASNGKLYGLTSAGGTGNYGVLFEYVPATNTLTKKIDFAGTGNGSNPYGSLVAASNGKLYGLTSQGGTSNLGVLFEYNPATNTLTKKADLTGTANGSNPYGSLIQAGNNKLYGMTNGGGANSLGVLFEYDPSTNTLTKKIDFAGTSNGSNPTGSLVLASNGKLYGMTFGGGANDFGVLFEYDASLNTLTVKNHFNGNDGRLPYYTSLIEVCAAVAMNSQPTSSAICQGSNTSFDVSATGTNLTYQWQVNTGGGFTNVTNVAPYSGATTNTLSITAATAGMNGYTYQCIVYSPCAAQYISNSVTLTVNTAPNVTTHPSNASGCPGSNTAFAVVASGAGLSYQWQVNTGSGFVDVTNAAPYSGATLSTLSITALTNGMNGYHYRCVITGTCSPEDTSNAASLSVNASVNVSHSPAICSNETYTLPDNSVVSAPGTYIDTLQTVNGCDSVITTNLTVYPTQVSSQNPVICANGSFILPDGSSVNTQGTYTTTLPSMHGCDSVITTHLTVNPVYAIPQAASICQNDSFYLPDSTVVYAQGLYTTTFQSITGCDSVITTSLTVFPAFAVSVNPAICHGDSIMLPDSSVVYTTGTYITTLHSVHGCDSVITTNLTVNPAYAITLSPGICQGETYTLPDGTIANVPGTYTVPFQTMTGCDSIYTIHLSIYPIPDPPVVTMNNDTVYSSSPIGNQWYGASGILTGDTGFYFVPSQNGDYYSIVTIHGCTSDTSNVVSFFTGIDHFPGASNNILLYPNPVNSELTIEVADLSNNCKFEILNATGQIVFSSTLDKKTTVNTGSYARGLYLVRIFTNDMAISKRFVKQ